ncbi:MAG TPA: hypothetical protein VF263_11555, partial [Longimicrobiaceae bacterium]
MNWTVSRRIAAGFALALGLLVVVAVMASLALNRATEAYRTALDQQRRHELPIIAAQKSFQSANLQFVRHLLEPGDRWVRERDERLRDAARYLEALRDSATSRQAEDRWRETLRLLQQWDEASRASMALAGEGRRDEALRVRDARALPLADQIGATMERGIEVERTTTEARVRAARDSARRMSFLLGVGTVI